MSPAFQDSTKPETSQSARSDEGLVQSHISPRASENSPSLSVFADIVKVHIPAETRTGGGLRGQVHGFTRQSRKRFLESFARARNIEGGSFVTLTYPAEFPTDPVIYHGQLDTLLKRLARWEPNARGWWRLEFQERGAPHYHLLIFGARRNTRQLRRWFKVAWYAVVKSGDPKHLAAGTQVDVIHNRKHAGRYIAKYAAKVDQADPPEPCNAINKDDKPLTGRLWGSFGAIDQAPVLSVSLAPWQVVEIKRLLVRWLHSRASKFERRLARSPACRGFSVFGAGDQSITGINILDQTTIGRMVALFSSA